LSKMLKEPKGSGSTRHSVEQWPLTILNWISLSTTGAPSPQWFDKLTIPWRSGIGQSEKNIGRNIFLKLF
jgi:hypothetical protein